MIVIALSSINGIQYHYTLGNSKERLHIANYKKRDHSCIFNYGCIKFGPSITFQFTNYKCEHTRILCISYLWCAYYMLVFVHNVAYTNL